MGWLTKYFPLLLLLSITLICVTVLTYIILFLGSLVTLLFPWTV